LVKSKELIRFYNRKNISEIHKMTTPPAISINPSSLVKSTTGELAIKLDDAITLLTQLQTSIDKILKGTNATTNRNNLLDLNQQLIAGVATLKAYESVGQLPTTSHNLIQTPPSGQLPPPQIPAPATAPTTAPATATHANGLYWPSYASNYNWPAYSANPAYSAYSAYPITPRRSRTRR
jgi:hypothetical protein